MTKTLTQSVLLLEALPGHYQEEEPRAWFSGQPQEPELVLVCADNLRTWSSASIGGASPSQLPDLQEMTWGDILQAAQDTSFELLAHEPDMYSESDGEPL